MPYWNALQRFSQQAAAQLWDSKCCNSVAAHINTFSPYNALSIVVLSQYQDLRLQNASGFRIDRKVLVMCFKLWTMNLRMVVGILWRIQQWIAMDLKFRIRAQMLKKSSTEIRRPKATSTVQIKCLDPKYQLWCFINKEHSGNLNVKHIFIKTTVFLIKITPQWVLIIHAVWHTAIFKILTLTVEVKRTLTLPFNCN